MSAVASPKMGCLDTAVPREGSFEPVLIPKHERRFTGFDDKIVAMYARGMTVREIQGFLTAQYGTEVSAEFINSVTDVVMAEVTAWQSRPLEPMYPVVRNKAIYLALDVLPDGTRDIPGDLDREHRGGEVLAEGLQRPQDPRSRRHPNRRHRWSQGHSGGPGSGSPSDDPAA